MAIRESNIRETKNKSKTALCLDCVSNIDLCYYLELSSHSFPSSDGSPPLFVAMSLLRLLRPFPIWGRYFEFLFSMFSCLVLLLSVLLSLFFFNFLRNISSPQYSIGLLSFGIHSLPLPCFHHYKKVYNFLCLSLHMAQPSQSCFSHFVTNV